jgi:hypothetical protein
MAAGLKAIHEACAARIEAGVARDWNVAAFPFSGMPLPLIEVWPGSGDYIAYWGTFGATGTADLVLDIRIQVATGDAETTFIQITDMLSVGTGHTSSVVDALMEDKTLGGTVLTLRALSARWTPDGDDLGSVAVIPVEIVLRKAGAEV